MSGCGCTYVGTLEAVVTTAGQTFYVERRALGVAPHGGIVTAADRSDLAAGIVDGKPARAKRVGLQELWYQRSRKGHRSDRWYHRTPGAHVHLLREGARWIAWISAPSEGLCTIPGDFLCSG